MPMELGWHPHSGIATVTVVLGGVKAIRYAGKRRGSPASSAPAASKWMRAGNGVWHMGAPEPQGVRGFQLWVALPPELENAPNASHYVMPEESPTDGPVPRHPGLAREDEEPNRRACHELPRREPESRRALVLPACRGARGGLGRGARGSAPDRRRPFPGGEIAIFEPSQAPIQTFSPRRTRCSCLGSAPAHRHELALWELLRPHEPEGLAPSGRGDPAASARASSPMARGATRSGEYAADLARAERSRLLEWPRGRLPAGLVGSPGRL